MHQHQDIQILYFTDCEQSGRCKSKDNAGNLMFFFILGFSETILTTRKGDLFSMLT